MNTVVTGASRGIGRETAGKLAREGHRVIATARSEDRLKSLASGHPDIHFFSADLTHREEIDELAGFVKERYGESIDVLINNAGALVNKPFEELTREDWQAMISSNLYSAVDLTRTLIPGFSSPAHIVNISSMGGYQGSEKFPGLTAYSVAKGALSILGECLAREFGDRDIRVNTLCLGAVQTEMLKEAFPGFEAPLTAEQMAEFITDFSVNGHRYFNGKILPVALDDPG